MELSIPEKYNRDEFPHWVNNAIDEWMDQNEEYLHANGINPKSVTFAARCGENVARITFRTSIGEIPLRVVRPQEAV